MPKIERRSGRSNDEIYAELVEIKQILAERKHFDTMVEENSDLLKGNGKPGFRAVRDKVEGWDIKINGLLIFVIGDLLVRAIGFFTR